MGSFQQNDGSSLSKLSISNPQKTYETSDSILGADGLVGFKHVLLHPKSAFGDHPFIVAVTRKDKLLIRKFKVVPGFSAALGLDEQKPGFNSFDFIHSKEGLLTTFQVKKIDPKDAKNVETSSRPL